VTFIVGFHCYDGMVLCSDSEESDGINKHYVDKLYARNFPVDIGLCFGGDDDAIGIEKFREALFGIMASEKSDATKTVLTVEKVLEHMKTMYSELNFSIILAQCNLKSGDMRMYRTYGKSPLRPIEWGRFACIGHDTSLANFAISSLFDAYTGVKEAARIGVSATALMKKHASGVSGPSSVYTYKKGDDGWERLLSFQINEIEQQYSLDNLSELSKRNWQLKNPDIWSIVDDLPIRISGDDLSG
jgi:20S proteasome alpha/beta subunit